MNKKVIIIISILSCITAMGFAVFYFTSIVPANKIMVEVRNIEIADIDLEQIADGNYVGEFSYSKSHCKVEVVVRGHKIDNIVVLESGKNNHAKKAEAVLKKIIEKQKTNVDVIAGATTTSKALLRAVETALSKQ